MGLDRSVRWVFVPETATEAGIDRSSRHRLRAVVDQRILAVSSTVARRAAQPSAPNVALG